MTPIKSTTLRSLRSQIRPQRLSLIQSASRGIAATSSNPNIQEISRSQLPLTPFRTPDLHNSSRSTMKSTHQQRTHQDPFSNLVNSITDILTTSSSPSLPKLHDLLRAYSSDATHWEKYAHANPDKQYTRNLVCEVPGVFNLLLLVWTPGKKSPVHDHADSHCLMKVLKGGIREKRFAVPERPGEQGALVQTSSVGFGLNKVSYMVDQLGLHSISNPHPTEYAVSLHLYTPPNAATRGCHIYDERSGEAEHVMQGDYDSVEGKVPATKA